MFRSITQFLSFQSIFNKKYKSFTEMRNRFVVFNENVRIIKQHNEDKSQTFKMAINQFTDFTPEEFKSYVGQLTFHPSTCSNFSSTNQVANSWDWRMYNAVTPVKNQGQCGSCWAFSSTGSTEGAWAIKTGELINLSEQELVDCSGLRYGNNGCNGGQIDSAFEYSIVNGQCSSLDYPYTAEKSKCYMCESVTSFRECFNVATNDQVSLKVAVALQPVAVAIDANSYYFQSYSSGILTSEMCGTDLDHGVLIVGYNQEEDIPYWIVKNSWGDTWGENGYVRIAISNSSEGICGIAMAPSFIVV